MGEICLSLQVITFFLLISVTTASDHAEPTLTDGEKQLHELITYHDGTLDSLAPSAKARKITSPNAPPSSPSKANNPQAKKKREHSKAWQTPKKTSTPPEISSSAQELVPKIRNLTSNASGEAQIETTSQRLTKQNRCIPDNISELGRLTQSPLEKKNMFHLVDLLFFLIFSTSLDFDLDHLDYLPASRS